MGRRLLSAAESWLIDQDVQFLQDKTLASAHPSLEYDETRRFYDRMGFKPLEVFSEFWGTHLPVLQLVKTLKRPRS